MWELLHNDICMSHIVLTQGGCFKSTCSSATFCYLVAIMYRYVYVELYC